MAWKAETFPIGTFVGVCSVAGYTYCGLGFHLIASGSPKGRRKAKWALSHLNSGLRIAVLSGDISTVSPVATLVAESGDWSFDGPTGWRNQFPDAREQVRQIIAKHPKIIAYTGGPMRRETEAMARAVLDAREAA